MAADALAAFLERDFARTDQALLSLSSADPATSSVPQALRSSIAEDPRIKHNALIAKFYLTLSHSDLENILLFVSEFLPQQQLLSQPQKQHQQQQQKQLQHSFSLDQFLSTALLDPKTVKSISSHVGPVTLYNIAVIAYHRHAIRAAAVVGERLFENIEALEEWLALSTCFLLADVYLRLENVSKANAVLTHADKLLPSFARQSNALSDSSSSTPSAAIKTLAPRWPGRTTAVLESPSSYEHAKFCMHIYNARLSAASDGADGSRSIRKEAKSAVLAADDAHSRPTSAALLVKARVEQSFSKGLRILASIVSQSPQHMLPKVRPLALNTLGILHHRMGRHALAACYFEHSRRAFRHLFPPMAETPAPSDKVYLSVFNSISDTHVAYNLALQYMKFGDFSRALDLFTASAHADQFSASNSPRLWIRMAECCVGIASRQTGSACSVHATGRGRGRRLIARSTTKQNHLYMEYAATCARSAIAILDKRRETEEDSAEKGENTTQGNAAASRRDGKATADDQETRAAALTLIAYASLSFDANAVVAACDELLTIFPKTDTERSALVLLYAAEAYCKLGQPRDAARRLAPLLSVSSSVESHVREAAYVNIGLTHACANDLITASRAARVSLKLFTSEAKRSRPLRREAIISAAYVFLRNGEIDAARQALRMLQPS